MSRLLLRLDGQNMNATLLDTDELSVLRGGGLAMLYTPECLFKQLDDSGHAVEVVYAGSSEGVAYVTPKNGDEAALQAEVEAFLAGQASSTDPMTQDVLPILPFLTFSFSMKTSGSDADFVADNRELTNKNRANQFTALTVDRLPAVRKTEPELQRPCEIDRTRPIAAVFPKGGDKIQVSASVYARQKYGKNLRQRFYRDELGPEAILSGDKGYRFSDDFGEIALTPRGKDMKEMKVPLKLQGKMAVLYGDGNGWGRIKKKHCKVAKDYGEFSDHVRHKRREMLSKIVEEVCGALCKDPADETKWVIPMETLLWGGDEFCLVLPAWSALKVLEKVAPMLNQGWEWRGERLTQAWGLVFCHHKTPIREVRRLADSLAESVKDLRDIHGANVGRQGNYLQYMVLMGMDPPPQGVGHFREKHFKVPQHLDSFHQARPFTFDLAHFTESMNTMREFLGLPLTSGQCGAGVPPSQLYKFRALALEGALLDNNAASRELENQKDTKLKDAASQAFEAWTKTVDKKLEGYQDSRGDSLSWRRLADDGHLAYDPAYPLMPLFHLLQLGEYVDPFVKRGGQA